MCVQKQSPTDRVSCATWVPPGHAACLALSAGPCELYVALVARRQQAGRQQASKNDLKLEQHTYVCARTGLLQPSANYNVVGGRSLVADGPKGQA